MQLKLYMALFFLLTSALFPQTVNGKILSTSNNISIIKVWGTHQQRGYAQGYLMADRIETLLSNYIRGRFPSNYYLYARLLLQDTMHLKFDAKYVEEAQAMIQGMKVARTISSDYLDVLIANCFLDILGFLSTEKSDDSPYGCSSLMSWGAATQGTFLQGKSIITRNLDWEPDTNLCANQVMVIHVPSETNEQPWAMIGFAGQLGVLSGTNKSGVSVFQHVLHVSAGPALTGMHYEPIWMTLRKAIEMNDFNNDGKNNTADVQAAINTNPQGYAASCIVSSLSSSANIAAGQDSLIAMVAEVTHADPVITFRSSSFNDSIPGANLYAANSPVKRENALEYEPRYLSVINAIGNGILVDSAKSWAIMRDSSRVVDGNIELIQVIPEMKVLKISVYRNNHCAYSSQPVTYGLDSLFANVVAVQNNIKLNPNFSLQQNYPNPFNPVTTIRFHLTEKAQVELSVYNQLGSKVASLVNGMKDAGEHEIQWNAGTNASGVYLYELKSGNNRIVKKLVLLK